MIELKGKIIYPGTAVGKAAISSFASLSQSYGSQDVYGQKERYLKAKGCVKNELVSLCATAFDNDVCDIIKSYILILEDEEFDSLVLNIINVEKTSAECAVKKASKYFAGILKKSGDSYIKGRISDVYDISDRLRVVLKDIENPAEDNSEKLPEDSAKPSGDEKIILVSEYMSVTEIIKRGKQNIAGLISTKNTLHSHASIVARSLGIPAIIVNDIKDIRTLKGKTILIDGNDSKVYIEPDEKTVEDVLSRGNASANSLSENAAVNADSKTGANVFGTQNDNLMKIYANVQNAQDVEDAIKLGADGIGLFRTEMIFLSSDKFPTEEEQFEIYKAAAINATDKNIILRTMDLGDDKTSEYLNLEGDDNPLNGLRAIKLCLAMPDIFKTQLRALLSASAFGNVSIMFPMISSMDEAVAVKQIVDEVKAEFRSKNIAFNESVKVGTMIETPAAVEIADALAKEFDFFSVGSNDLTQYALGIDRLKSDEERFYDQKNPKVLALMKRAVEAAHNAGITVGICGELASDISFTRNLSEIGFDYISVSVPVLDKLISK